MGTEALYPGDYFTLQCSIIHGDLPISIYWTFNGAQLIPTADIVLSNMGSRSSVLTIESVRGNNAGNYTCFGTNAAGQSEHSVNLVVNGYYILPFIMGLFIIVFFFF